MVFFYWRCTRYLEYTGAPFNAAQIYQCAFDCGEGHWQHRGAGRDSTDTDAGGVVSASESDVTRREGGLVM